MKMSGLPTVEGVEGLSQRFADTQHLNPDEIEGLLRLMERFAHVFDSMTEERREYWSKVINGED